ncbi:MAG TPA: tRNA (N6-threonylcarbamoyladenosine(37)-N6)-methyltransferase TrmO [Candidatus Lokiarchaeia archaeon]|nr:tRNA (N6-threonylcarbamoyladenosine(37)-N6)-methyltransferase TrmO [Candidatus Lokiarchaeia archaeon]
MNGFSFKEIGIIHSPFTRLEDMPIQPFFAEGTEGTVEIHQPYAKGLKDLSGFSLIYLIYYFHLAQSAKLQIKPFLDDKIHGIFATRGPLRPNPIGLSIVELLDVSENILQIRNVDVVDGTPLLDIKPYIPQFDQVEVNHVGWLEGKFEHINHALSDDRFAGDKRKE